MGGTNLNGFNYNNPLIWADVLGKQPALFLPPGAPGAAAYNDAMQELLDGNGPSESDVAVALAIIEIWVPLSAAQAAYEGRWFAAVGELALGKVRIVGKIPGAKKLGAHCCVKVRAIIERFKNPPKLSAAEKVITCQGGTAAKTPLGDLTTAEIKQIQGTVDAAGRPLEVVGSAARGTRREVGTDLPIGKDPPDMPGTTRSDIDYLAPPSSHPYFEGQTLPSIGPEGLILSPVT
jgi:hypothetical protein